MSDLIDREEVRQTLYAYIPGFRRKTIDKIVDGIPSAQPKEVFEIGKPYPLKGFEFKIWKDAYGGDWVEIRKYQEPWEGNKMDDLISRQAVIDAIVTWTVEDRPDAEMPTDLVGRINTLPSAQPERDIPVKPIETTDRAWGIPHRQAVCPKCDYYLGHVAFLGDYKGKRITYCETCGQAIDWEGWDFDE